jgi:hypothetical protein
MNPPSDPIAMLAGGAAFAVLAAVYGICAAIQSEKRKRRDARLDAAADAQYRAWLAEVNRTGGIQSCETDIRLGNGEECFFSARATLREPRAVRVSHHSGVGVRALKGLGVMGGQTTSESHDEWRKISKGTLYVTNERVIYAGDMQSRSIKIGDIISIGADARAILIRSSKRQKAMCYTGLNGQIARDMIKMIQAAT